MTSVTSTVNTNLQTAPAPAPGPASAPDDRATEFKAVEGEGAGEHFNGFTLMVEAYAAIWLIMMVWLFFIWRKQADITSRVDGLEAALVRAERRYTGGGAAKTTPEKKEKEKETEKEPEKA